MTTEQILNNFDDNVSVDGDKLIFQCPHCFLFVEVLKNDLNCKIFRHAVFKNNGQNINPHASESECNNLIISDSVVGCAKPFQIVQISNESYKVQQCGYI